ncbi:MAG: nuclear transport factor 2 family protein [Nitrospirales bacterium]|nr:nuclear transport factor 2 family protein [Nitrospirales bacterium]
MKADANAEKDIVQCLRNLTDAYGKRDIDRFLSCFAQDPDVMMIEGPYKKIVGLQEIRAEIEKDWHRLDCTQVEYKRPSIFTSGSVAYVSVDTIFHTRQNGVPSQLSGMISGVLEKSGSGWLWMLSDFSSSSAYCQKGEIHCSR